MPKIKQFKESGKLVCVYDKYMSLIEMKRLKSIYLNIQKSISKIK